MNKNMQYKTIVVDEKTHDAVRLAAFRRRVSMKLIIEKAVAKFLENDNANHLQNSK